MLLKKFLYLIKLNTAEIDPRGADVLAAARAQKMHSVQGTRGAWRRRPRHLGISLALRPRRTWIRRGEHGVESTTSRWPVALLGASPSLRRQSPILKTTYVFSALAALAIIPLGNCPRSVTEGIFIVDNSNDLNPAIRRDKRANCQDALTRIGSSLALLVV